MHINNIILYLYVKRITLSFSVIVMTLGGLLSPSLHLTSIQVGTREQNWLYQVIIYLAQNGDTTFSTQTVVKAVDLDGANLHVLFSAINEAFVYPSLNGKKLLIGQIKDSNDPARATFYLQDFSSDQRTLISLSDSVLYASRDDNGWSPDSSSFLFIAESKSNTISLYKYNMFDSSFIKVCNCIHGSVSALSWSPDGSKIAFIDSLGEAHGILEILNKDGTNPHQLVEGRIGLNLLWAPNNQGLLVGTKGSGQVKYIDIASGSQLLISDGHSSDTANLPLVYGPFQLWSPDSKSFLLLSGAATGKKIYKRFGIDFGDKVVIASVEADSFGIESPQWSPDGNNIIYIEKNFSNETAQLVMINDDGSNPVQLASGINIDGVSWSPDGNYIMYITGRETKRELHIIGRTAGLDHIISGQDNVVQAQWSMK